MALVLADRCQETTSTTGTGSFTLTGAVLGYQTFLAGIGNGNRTYYTAVEQASSNWEIGIGSLSSGTTLSRDTIIASSNAGAIVTFGSGVKNVFVDMPSEMVGLGGSGCTDGGRGMIDALGGLPAALQTLADVELVAATDVLREGVRAAGGE